jgi:hypothetical protein
MLALGATSWYEARQEQSEAREILVLLKEALESDLQFFKANYGDLEQSAADVSELILKVESQEPFSDAIRQQLRSAIRWRGVSLRTAPYDALKNRGLDLISDTGLRTQIVEFYEYEYQRVYLPTENDRKYSNDSVAPYFRQNFLQDDDMGWTPHKWEAILDDPYFLNLLRGKKFRFQNFLLPAYSEAIAAMEEMLEEL